MPTPPLRRVLNHLDAWFRSKIAERRDGVVPFFEGRFAATDDRAALVARTYNEGGQLAALIEEHPGAGGPDGGSPRALDVGCGYGRLTPYLMDAPRINSVHGVEPNDDARSRAADLYPQITFAEGVAQDIPYPDDHFGLVVAWTVLQHIPDDAIERVASELTRITASGGYLITCDKTAGRGTPVVYPRPVSHYEALFSRFECASTRDREMEPGAVHDGDDTVMVFRRAP